MHGQQIGKLDCPRLAMSLSLSLSMTLEVDQINTIVFCPQIPHLFIILPIPLLIVFRHIETLSDAQNFLGYPIGIQLILSFPIWVLLEISPAPLAAAKLIKYIIAVELAIPAAAVLVLI